MFGKLFGKKKVGPHLVHIEGVDKPVECDEKTFILSAALRDGIAIPYSCRVGGCGTCKVRLLEGKVKEFTDKTYLLSQEELRANYILSCQCQPRSDVRIQVDGLDLSAEAQASVHEVVNRTGLIKALNHLTHDIVEVRIELDGPMAYTAGEYSDMRVPGVLDEFRSYSFAARPDPAQANRVIFHIRKVPGGKFTEWLHQADRIGARVELRGPFGDFRLRSAAAPMVCVAGGSGMAPIKALLEQALVDGVQRDCTYLFGARSQKDLYCQDDMDRIAAQWKGRFRYIPILSEEPEDSDWTGPRGLVTEFLTREVPELATCHAYMCGPPPMLDAAIEVLKGAGIPGEHIHFDKFLDKSHLAKAHIDEPTSHIGDKG
ncbi:MAG: 2Fe-2S iron-sulfur cluster binding domain-containing protein [Pseudomonadota bacterium]|nr:2Fe-2S iron-sulfur cluster binding domain-containing protein [Pseudomonadota bacterium]